MNEMIANATVAGTRVMRLRCGFGVSEAIGSAIIWIVLTIITLGLALFVFPYFLNKSLLNRTEVLDSQGRAIGRLNCKFGVASSVGHLLVWMLLTIATLGLAGFVYVYRVIRVVLNETAIEFY